MKTLQKLRIRIAARMARYSLEGFSTQELSYISAKSIGRRLRDARTILGRLETDAVRNGINQDEKVRKALNLANKAHCRLSEYYFYDRISQRAINGGTVYDQFREVIQNATAS